MRIVTVLGLVLMTSCAVQPHSTVSGHPEVTVPGQVAQKLSNDIVNAMVDRGYTIKTQSANLLAFDRPAGDSFTAMLFFGSKFAAVPNARIEYTLAELSDSTRVVATLKVVTNPGSAFERFTDLSAGKDSHHVQDLLNQIAGHYQAQPANKDVSGELSAASAACKGASNMDACMAFYGLVRDGADWVPSNASSDATDP